MSNYERKAQGAFSTLYEVLTTEVPEGSVQDTAVNAAEYLADELLANHALLGVFIPRLRRKRGATNEEAVARILETEIHEARQWCLSLGIDPDGKGKS